MPKQDTFETEQLTDAAFYILLALIEPLHGYAIMKYIEQMTGVPGMIGPGTLYTPVSYTHLTLPTTSRGQRQMCIRDSCIRCLKRCASTS